MLKFFFGADISKDKINFALRFLNDFIFETEVENTTPATIVSEFGGVSVVRVSILRRSGIFLKNLLMQPLSTICYTHYLYRIFGLAIFCY